MKKYILPEWKDTLSHNGLDRFETLWNLPFEPLDQPNRRGGPESFSVVGLVEIQRPDGGRARLVMKKQQNYLTRTVRRPISGIPTFETELTNIIKYQQKGLPTLKPVFFAKRAKNGRTQAVFISEYLEGYVPLASLLEGRKASGEPNKRTFSRIIRAVARVVRQVHDCGFQYGCMYPKHIFIKHERDTIAVRLIDLEKSRYRPFGRGRIHKDLETLYRHGGWMVSRTDMLRFVLEYIGEAHSKAKVLAISRGVTSRNKKKSGSRSALKRVGHHDDG